VYRHLLLVRQLVLYRMVLEQAKIAATDAIDLLTLKNNVVHDPHYLYKTDRERQEVIQKHRGRTFTIPTTSDSSVWEQCGCDTHNASGHGSPSSIVFECIVGRNWYLRP